MDFWNNILLTYHFRDYFSKSQKVITVVMAALVILTGIVSSILVLFLKLFAGFLHALNESSK